MWVISFGTDFFVGWGPNGNDAVCGRAIEAMQFEFENDARTFQREYLNDEGVVVFDPEITINTDLINYM